MKDNVAVGGRWISMSPTLLVVNIHADSVVGERENVNCRLGENKLN